MPRGCVRKGPKNCVEGEVYVCKTNGLRDLQPRRTRQKSEFNTETLKASNNEGKKGEIDEDKEELLTFK